MPGRAGIPLSRAILRRDFIKGVIASTTAVASAAYLPGGPKLAQALLASNPHPTREEARAAMAGNLCRCGAYDQYLNSIMRAPTGCCSVGYF